jgi:hypothetical protein
MELSAGPQNLMSSQQNLNVSGGRAQKIGALSLLPPSWRLALEAYIYESWRRPAPGDIESESADRFARWMLNSQDSSNRISGTQLSFM